MNIYDFYSKVNEHQDLVCAGVTFSRESAEDRIMIHDRSRDVSVSLVTRDVLDGVWEDLLVQLSLSADEPALDTPQAHEVVRALPCWSRSLVGELKQRAEQSYRVTEALISR